ncbi:MAG: site-2 protease family protein [Clostridiales bacterium]|nr:site-2 protease family protein [Clostridiales bacterium]
MPSIIEYFQNLDWYGMLLSILYSLPAIVMGLTVHEYAHAKAAVKMGDTSQRVMARTTLNPFTHLDPVGFICMIIFNFGWAKPVVTDPTYYRSYRKGRALVALAGPLSNLIFAGIFYLIETAIYVFSELTIGKGMFLDSSVFITIVYILQLIVGNFVMINILLFVINILPIPGFDGYELLKMAFFPNANGRVITFFETYSRYIFIALVLVGLFDYVVFFTQMIYTYGVFLQELLTDILVTLTM